MQTAQWMNECRGLLNVPIQSGVNCSELKDFAVKYYKMMSEENAEINFVYEDIDEDSLDVEVQTAAAELRTGGLACGDLSTASLSKLVGMLAVRLRVVDQELLDEWDWRQSHIASSWRASGGYYVLPRHKARLRDVGLSKKFKKRGMLFHRIVPASLYGYKIIPRWVDTSIDEDNAKIGAALFDPFSLETEVTENGFIVSGLVTDDALAQIDDQVKEMSKIDCSIAAWPELTMPPASVDHLAASLAVLPRSQEISGPDLVLAGSWHLKRGAKFRNISYVLDGYGNKITYISKISPFFSKKEGREDIRRGKIIQILIAGGSAIALGICKDFCDKAHYSVLQSIDVDLICVVSMGGEETMREHLKAASDIKIKNGSETFVVQQFLDDDIEKDGKWLGYVLAPRSNYASLSAGELLKYLRWTA